VPIGLYPVVCIAKSAVETRASSSESCTATGDLMRDAADKQWQSNRKHIAILLRKTNGRMAPN
jgi:hypothetical protein